jgi:hypothetical protein
MKKSLKIHTRAIMVGAVSASCALLSTSFSAKASNPWILVDDFQYLSSAEALGVAQDVYGTLYAVGQGASNGVWRALTRRSTDGGVSWTTVDDYLYPNSQASGAHFNSVGTDAAGNVYAVGQASVAGTLAAGGGNHWIVRKSSDGGITWATMDDFFGPGVGAGAYATGVLAHNSSGIYVMGYGDSATTGSGRKVTYVISMVVRRSTDHGATWSTVDNFSGAQPSGAAITDSGAGIFVGGLGSGGSIVRFSSSGNANTWSTVDSYTPSLGAEPYAAGTDANGNVYFAGWVGAGTKQCSYADWFVRRSTDNGVTWSNADSLPPQGTPCGLSAIVHGFGLDSSDNIVTVGIDDYGTLAPFWLTRSSASGVAGAWSNTDEYQYAPGVFTSGTAICRDTAGNLFATGYAGPADDSHWLVRKQAP